MSSILIRNVRCNGSQQDVLVAGNKFERFDPPFSVAPPPEVRVLDGTGMALVPPFFNAHTHHAMALLRGFADDLPLHEWLNDHIWPAEARMTREHMLAGVRLAALEAIRSGSVFFNDMYFNWAFCAPAVEEMGLRAVVGDTLMSSTPRDAVRQSFERAGRPATPSGRIRWSLAPHAVYTADEALLRETAEVARATGATVHIHVSETEREVRDCFAAHGCSPVEWLHRLGLLSPNLVAAHAVHLSDRDLELLADSGAAVIHNPSSNMKLGSGAFPAAQVLARSIPLLIGTDGPASNNSVDMHAEMRLAALLAKLPGDPAVLPAPQALDCATAAAARIFGIDSGVLAPGHLADALVVDLSDPRLVPDSDFVSNWVYAADNASIVHVLCDGRLLMENRFVPHQDEILEDARRAARELLAMRS